MTSKWAPVADLVRHLMADDDLMLRWTLVAVGDVRSPTGRSAAVRTKKADLAELVIALEQRVAAEEARQ